MLLSKIGFGVAVGAALVLGAGPALAGGAWTIVPAPPTGQDASLSGVTTTSDTDAWAVGYCCARPNFLGAIPIIDHWNGTAWSHVSVPSTGYSTNSLTAVSASSATDAWAVGAATLHLLPAGHALERHRLVGLDQLRQRPVRPDRGRRGRHQPHRRL